jgi:hypothetical protein
MAKAGVMAKNYFLERHFMQPSSKEFTEKGV